MSPQSDGPVESRSSDRSSQRVIPLKCNNLRILVANVNLIAGKAAELISLVRDTDPDIILMSETKLDKHILSSEFLPLGY